jgi:hypothetical protein
MAAFQLARMLETLKKQQVDFIVVGNVSAALQGAPVTTFDLDIVHSRAEANIERLLAALVDMDAHYREQQSRKIVPRRSNLAGPGHQLLVTRYGPLDVLGVIEGDRDYDALLSSTNSITLKDGSEISVLNLETLIMLKETAPRPKDVAVLPVLKQTLAERNRPRQ